MDTKDKAAEALRIAGELERGLILGYLHIATLLREYAAQLQAQSAEAGRVPLTDEQVAALTIMLYHFDGDPRTQCLRPLVERAHGIGTEPAQDAPQARCVVNGLTPYEATEDMVSKAQAIDPALPVPLIRAMWSTMWSAAQPAQAAPQAGDEALMRQALEIIQQCGCKHPDMIKRRETLESALRARLGIKE
jgi:hypothetical protein